jgi:glycosyltransferase involved in cell wall biosynthesis
VSDVDSFFEAIDVLVVPSLAGEGQPTVILEALGRGVPVVVRKCWWEPSFDGLPVSWYETADDLAAALPADSPSRPDPEELSRRFGAEQVVAGLEFAARQIG